MAKKFKDLQAEWNKSDSRKYIRAKLPTPQANVKSESAWDSYRETALLEAALDKPTRSPEQIAKKHGVSVEKIEAQLKDGIKVEQEHTSDLEVAREIALDHLGERPDYYTQVKKAKLEEAKLHHVLKGHPYHHKSDAELHYIIKDAGEAERAVGDHDPKAMNKYADQRCDASTVLGYRHRGGVRVPHPKLNESNRDTNFYSASPAERRRVGSIQTLTARAKRLRKMLTPRVTIKKTMKEELTPREQQSHRERLRPSEPPKHDPDEQVKKQQAEHDKNTLGMMRNIVFHKKLPSGSHLKEEAPHAGHVMNFSDRMEHSYHGYSQAKKDRDAYATHLQSKGIKVKKSSISNQLLHGSYGNVYKVSHTGHMEESYNIVSEDSGPRPPKMPYYYPPKDSTQSTKLRDREKNKKALFGRIGILNRKTVREEYSDGMFFHAAVKHAKACGNRVTFGTLSKKWHSIGPKDRDYHTPFALDPDEAKRQGEAHSFLTSTGARRLEETRLHHVLKGHPYHHKSDAELHYIIKDAREAEEAVAGHDTKAMHKYADQRCDASTVLGYRQRGGKQVPGMKPMKEELTPREQQSHAERLKPAEAPKHDSKIGPDPSASWMEKRQREAIQKRSLDTVRHLDEGLREIRLGIRKKQDEFQYLSNKHGENHPIAKKASDELSTLLGKQEEHYMKKWDQKRKAISEDYAEKYSAKTLKLIEKIKLQKKNKKGLLGRIGVLNRKTVQEAFKAAKDKKNGKAPEKDSKNPFAKKDVKPQKEVQDNLPGDGANEPNKDVSAAPPQFGAGKVEAGAPGAEKKVSNTPTPERKSSKIQVKGPGPDDKFQDSPIVTPLLTMADTASPKSGSQGVR